MKFSVKIALALSCALFFIPAFSEPANLSLLKKEVQAYHDSGTYEKELTTSINQAKHYMLKQVAMNNLRKKKLNLAIVLDIDETSLSNYNQFVEHNFAATQDQIHRSILAADAPPIKPMLSLYNEALKNGVKVFFVTGRHASEMAATKANLLNAGYKDWSGLYLRPDDYNHASIVPFKTHARALISKQGYTIVATIGDQYSDLLGGFAKKQFKLPNPYYFLP